jgi:hypothetical protein
MMAAVLPLPGAGFGVLRGSTSESSSLRASRAAVLKDSGVQGEGAQSEGEAASKAKDAPSSTGQSKGSGKTNDPNATQQTSGKGRGGGQKGPGNAKKGAPRGKPAKSQSGQPGKQGSPKNDQSEGQNKTQDGRAEKETDNQKDADKNANPDEKDASGKDQNDEKSSDDNENQNQDQNSSDSSQSTPQRPQLPFQAPSWLRGLIMVVGAIALIFGLIRYGPVLLQALRDFLASLFGGLFIEKRENPKKDQAVESEPVLPPRPFSSFANPFEVGLDQRFSPNDLVIYSFEALESWAYEHNLARSPNETPTEFVRRVGQVHTDLRQEASRVVGYFVTIVYGQRGFKDEVLPPLREFWRVLHS